MSSANQYFAEITQALNEAKAHYPTLLIDKQRLDNNIAHLNAALKGRINYRIVAKSLPCIELLKYISEQTGTKRFMSFHAPFVKHLIRHIPDADVLLGKPMPIEAVEDFYSWLKKQKSLNFKPQEQLQWLVDNNQRLKQYKSFAEENKLHLRISLEIDVGLHRGGYAQQKEFKQALAIIKDSPNLELSGLMGYEPHIVKIPSIIGGPDKAFKMAQHTYKQRINDIDSIFGGGHASGLCLNTGGSMTYPLYQKENVCNEVATASALVMPTDFDVYTLSHHEKALFIAAPVLKEVEKPELPMAAEISSLLRKLGLIKPKAVFIYGGRWLAKPFYPKGAKLSKILVPSTNQEMYELPETSQLKMGDFLYFRPTQSEAVLLQFGNIALYNQGKIESWWPVFDYNND